MGGRADWAGIAAAIKGSQGKSWVWTSAPETSRREPHHFCSSRKSRTHSLACSAVIDRGSRRSACWQGRPRLAQQDSLRRCRADCPARTTPSASRSTPIATSAKCNTYSTAASTSEPSSNGWLAPHLRRLLVPCACFARLNNLADQDSSRQHRRWRTAACRSRRCMAARVRTGRTTSGHRSSVQCCGP